MTAGQLAQAAYEASVNPTVSASDSQDAATAAATAYRTESEGTS